MLIQVNGKFVPLTQLSKIPNGAVVNALHGTLTLNTAAIGRDPARHARREEGRAKKPKKPKTQTGKFGGAVFRVARPIRPGDPRAGGGSEVKGAPSFASCTTKKGKAVTAGGLQRRRCSCCTRAATGKFRTRGRYSAATIRGTIWTIADRCDGTLVHAIKDIVTVNDFVLHKTIALHPGHSYLALAHPQR